MPVRLVDTARRACTRPESLYYQSRDNANVKSLTEINTDPWGTFNFAIVDEVIGPDDMLQCLRDNHDQEPLSQFLGHLNEWAYEREVEVRVHFSVPILTTPDSEVDVYQDVELRCDGQGKYRQSWQMVSVVKDLNDVSENQEVYFGEWSPGDTRLMIAGEFQTHFAAEFGGDLALNCGNQIENHGRYSARDKAALAFWHKKRLKALMAYRSTHHNLCPFCYIKTLGIIQNPSTTDDIESTKGRVPAWQGKKTSSWTTARAENARTQGVETQLAVDTTKLQEGMQEVLKKLTNLPNEGARARARNGRGEHLTRDNWRAINAQPRRWIVAKSPTKTPVKSLLLPGTVLIPLQGAMPKALSPVLSKGYSLQGFDQENELALIRTELSEVIIELTNKAREYTFLDYGLILETEIDNQGRYIFRAFLA